MRGVDISVATKLEADGWNSTTLSLYSHAGTHMDAPRHFLPDGDTLEQLDLAAYVGSAYVINLAPAEPRQLISINDLGPLEHRIGEGDRLLFAGRGMARIEMLWMLAEPNALMAAATGVHQPHGTLWRWLNRRRESKSA